MRGATDDHDIDLVDTPSRAVVVASDLPSGWCQGVAAGSKAAGPGRGAVASGDGARGMSAAQVTPHQCGRRPSSRVSMRLRLASIGFRCAWISSRSQLIVRVSTGKSKTTAVARLPTGMVPGGNGIRGKGWRSGVFDHNHDSRDCGDGVSDESALEAGGFCFQVSFRDEVAGEGQRVEGACGYLGASTSFKGSRWHEAESKFCCNRRLRPEWP